MNEPQLPLFDWVTTVMSEGYRKLAAFQFDEAEEHFRDVHQADQGGEEEVDKALSASSFWRSLVEQNRENPDTFSADKIYEELRRYEFGNMPGLLQLKKALLEYIADCLISDDRFYIHIGEVSDITWRMVNLEDKYIQLPAEITKTYCSRAVPLNDKALNVIKIFEHQLKAKERENPEWYEIRRSVSITSCKSTADMKSKRDWGFRICSENR
jgi:hypothetical protein